MSNPAHPESRVIETSISISAPLSIVRSVLLDFESYPTWAEFITSIKPSSSSTAPSVGDSLSVVLTPPGGSAMTMTPTIVHLEEDGFGWQGHLANIRGLFDGNHLFLLSEEEEQVETEGEGGGRGRGRGTKMIQREEFGGVLYAPLMNWLGMGDKTRKGFELFNQAVKKRAEALANDASRTAE